MALTTLQSQVDYFTRDQLHWLIPRTGTLIVQCLEIFGANSFHLWRYNNQDSSPLIPPSHEIPVDSTTQGFLARGWRDEAYGFQFPEEAIAPDDAREDLFLSLTAYCRMLQHNSLRKKGGAKSLSRSLKREKWAIFPLAISPFMEDAATNYCLVLTNDSELHEFIGLELAGSTDVLKWHNQSPSWPIPEKSEERAQILWDTELSETPRDVD